jgi:hypothetical protein
MQTRQITRHDWHDQLEIIGAAMFLRYRKRLDEPGILWAMRSEQAGLSLLDLWVRLQAGRRLLADGNDFLALQAIRSGEWQQLLQQREAERVVDRRGDGLSRVLVALGEGMVILFCLLTLSAWLLPHGQAWGVVALPVAAYLLWRTRRVRADRPMHAERSPAWPPEATG